MKCTEIKPGMIFDVPVTGVVWKVLRQGNYRMVDGKRDPIDNSRRNKWWCRPVDESITESLLCFDELFDNTQLWNFRWPEIIPTDMDIAIGKLIEQEIEAGRLDPNWVEKRREEIRKKGI